MSLELLEIDIQKDVSPADRERAVLYNPTSYILGNKHSDSSMTEHISAY